MCFSHISGFSAVTCYGSDGHVALEFIGSTSCCDNIEDGDDSHSASANKALSSSEDGCGPCVDTPLNAEAIEAHKKTNPVKSTSAEVPAISDLTIKDYDFCGYQSASKLFASVNPCLACLRTIILLA
jgi:hypothetical protein